MLRCVCVCVWHLQALVTATQTVQTTLEAEQQKLATLMQKLSSPEVSVVSLNVHVHMYYVYGCSTMLYYVHMYNIITYTCILR